MRLSSESNLCLGALQKFFNNLHPLPNPRNDKDELSFAGLLGPDDAFAAWQQRALKCREAGL